ncbi:MAG: hypothetical protein FIA92_05255 [Chloroflexi bacterium]|nr:hypothetical protein [Chloroflexota bacterium]
MTDRMHPCRRSAGQVLILFVLFLLVLLGVSALAIDVATWHVVDRNLQNVSDHAALAGASEFEDRTGGISCSSTNKCFNARAQAWTSLNDELGLGLSTTEIGTLAAADTGSDGASITAAGTTFTIWVTTPPPSYGAYTNAGGHYVGNETVVFVRVDRPVRSFLAGALGIQPDRRTGWATAGAIPTGLALQVFCRNQIAPQSGACGGSGQTALVIDGQGGIRLVNGDIGSNESLKVTAQGGQGVILQDGNVFLVSGTCDPNLWNCPNGPPSLGGISDGYLGKNAFYMAPLPVPRYESPVEYASLSICPDTSTWDANAVPCIPYRNQTGPDPAPSAGQWLGTWTCDNGIIDCGTPNLTTSPPTCGGGNYDKFYRPNVDQINQNPRWQGSQYNANSGNRYLNINDHFVDPGGSLPATLPAPLAGPPTNWVSSADGATNPYMVGLAGAEGIHQGGQLLVRYVLFRTANHAVDTASGPTVPVEIRLKERTANNTYVIRGVDSQTATEEVTVYEFAVPISLMTTPDWYNKLYLEFQVTTGVSGYGVGISWAEVEEANLQPRQAPRIPPGYWKTITIPANKCAILDPAHATGLYRYQLPGIFRFAGSGNNGIAIGPGGLLIGDGVTLVFDPSFPNKGFNIGAAGALLVNAGATSDPPLTPLPYPGSNAAWQVNPKTPMAGQSMWPVCTRGGNECVPRACYMNSDPDPAGVCGGQTIMPLQDGRGVTFYFTPDSWIHASVQIKNRFEMGGNGEANAPGIAFKGVLYAPYDDVKITGRNGFNTIGQVLAWTAKFNGGDAYIDLAYPYTDEPAPPYLLEPTISR